jgi:hypothetical protein
MQIPISAKVAMERFSRASSGGISTSTSSSMSSLLNPQPGLPRGSSPKVSDFGRTSTALPTTSAVFSLLQPGVPRGSSSPTSSDAGHISNTINLKPTKLNLLKILEGKAASTYDYGQSCCTADENISCEDSQGSCSVCSESTNSSVSSEEPAASQNSEKNVPGFGWANKKPKIKSEKILAKESVKQEKSAEGLKSFVYSLTIMEYFEAQKKGCNEKCAYGRQCLKKVDIDYIGNLREKFWGSKKDKAYNPKQRLRKIQDIFMTASAVKLQEKASIYITIPSIF